MTNDRTPDDRGPEQPDKRRPVDMKGIVEAAADANLPEPPPEEEVALRMRGAQVVLEPDSSARAGAMGVYPTIEQNVALRNAGYVQMGLDPQDPSNELTDPEAPLVPPEPPPEGGNGEGGEATEAPVVRDVPYIEQQGDTIHCTMGNWDGEPTSYSYAWKMDGMGIGTDDAFYVVQPGDVGGTATCVVTATNAIGSTEAPPSNAVTVA